MNASSLVLLIVGLLVAIGGIAVGVGMLWWLRVRTPNPPTVRATAEHPSAERPSDQGPVLQVPIYRISPIRADRPMVVRGVAGKRQTLQLGAGGLSFERWPTRSEHRPLSDIAYVDVPVAREATYYTVIWHDGSGIGVLTEGVDGLLASLDWLSRSARLTPAAWERMHALTHRSGRESP